jgi:predicted nucleotidyltransferase
MLMIPSEAENAIPVIRKHTGNTLAAVYLHGSAVTSGLCRESDVDLLVVLDRPLDARTRAGLTSDLMRISGRPGNACGVRPLELTIVLSDDLELDVYPRRYEFLYGEWLRSGFENGAVPEPSCDPDLSLVLAQARASAKTLIGPAATELLPEITQSDIRRAILDALPSLMASLEGDERNVLLTLARMWRTITGGDFVSKDVAAEWAINRVDAETAVVLEDARLAYLGLRTDDWSSRQQDARRAADSLHEHIRGSGRPE